MYKVFVECGDEYRGISDTELFEECETLEDAKEAVDNSKELYDEMEEYVMNLEKEELTEKIEGILDEYEYDEDEDDSNIDEIVDALGKLGIYALDLYDGVGDDIYESVDIDEMVEQAIDIYELDDVDNYGVVEDTDFTYVFNLPDGRFQRTIIYNDITDEVVNEDEDEDDILNIKRLKMMDKVEKEMKKRTDNESSMKFQSMQTLKEIFPAMKSNKVNKKVGHQEI